MPFKLKLFPNHNTGLVAICDICGKEATAQDANILWYPPDKDIPGDTYTPTIACKDPCTRKLDKLRARHHYSQELEIAILCLADNTQSDLKRARRTLLLMNGIIP